MKPIIFTCIAVLLISSQATARTCNVTKNWQSLCQVLDARVQQVPLKMKLKESEASDLEYFLQETPYKFQYLNTLQTKMPKTTVELLMAVQKRGVSEEQANLMAAYLIELVNKYQFRNLAAFDNNTSHIIGREWHEIDYSGESMTWQKQKKKYAPYGISNFKTVENLKKFFPVESKLPYFFKTYNSTN